MLPEVLTPESWVTRVRLNELYEAELKLAVPVSKVPAAVALLDANRLIPLKVSLDI